ncbi:hypothetical protein PR202_ga27533 [Eleusine coracana subsp. coracana]|uniref:RNA-dependent RNA polymerase n=1 Tax=Eleusine coracana subsp. coracana TaxID=191504 RepID=A0AAV5DH02_ELECO|nr:hypothetical protein PR202_ga27533 [Eleusine coracana subsp. coracana]
MGAVDGGKDNGMVLTAEGIGGVRDGEVELAPDIELESDTKDIIDFFLKNMTSDNIGRISNAHVVHADISKNGALNKKCIQLAELAATAVDSQKTGHKSISNHYLNEEKHKAYEMKASAWYHVTYHAEWVRRPQEMEANGEAKLSFT